MYSKDDMYAAEDIADKYIRLCCEMLADDGVNKKRFKRCASLLEDIVEDEIHSYFEGKGTTLLSVDEPHIRTYIGELFENFIEPMFMDIYIPKNILGLPKVDLSNIRKVRKAKTSKKVHFGSCNCS
jgi:hypothetical protein